VKKKRKNYLFLKTISGSEKVPKSGIEVDGGGGNSKQEKRKTMASEAFTE